MGRPRKEPTRIVSTRFPVRIWKLLKKVSKQEYRSLNRQILKLVEDFLVKEGHLKQEDRSTT
ncbi:MAG: hypothetical protein CMG31_06740 [Candidatus Marinimicrobia bacterium]|nr:hypothetical protein [Candidatus Neomarinimicrobiota bacterium]